MSMIGRILAHYEIIGLLGKGGMGEVYRALDTTLKREVALKLLPTDMAADPVRLERFQREAETVAKLSHPHVVHLYSLEEADGVHFLTMELVDGKGLDEVLTPGGLPLSRVFEVGIALSEALFAAHGEGIIHRDLKPANVMVTTAGEVKVLDFGLAKLSGDDASSEDSATAVMPITATGSVMGTVPYMSPEQFRGQEIDHRSDVFSLGIILYELATGKRPFDGPTNSDVGSSILRDTPPQVTQLKQDVPRHLGRIVARCLEKEPERRYQNARDIREDLVRLRDEEHSGGVPMGSGETPSQNVSIAVLPFVNMSSDEEQEYFSDGIAEELLNLLAKIPQLRVTSRSSAFSFKSKNLEIPEIAKRLNVANILEGSVRKAGNRVRITVQLIETGSDTHLWSETFDRTLDDIFAIQDEIAAVVVGQLRVTLLGKAPKSHETDPEAYALVMQAAHMRKRGTPESLEKAVELCRQALSIDAEYVTGWHCLGAVYTSLVLRGLRPRDEGYRLARESVMKTLAISPDYGPSHSVLGLISMIYEGDMAVAAQHMQRALALEPTNTHIVSNAASLTQYLGRLNEAIALIEYCGARDPVSPITQCNLGYAYMLAGRLDDAVATCRIAVTLSPDHLSGHYLLGTALLLKGEHKAALAAFQKETDEAYRVKGMTLALHALERQSEFDATFTELRERWGEQWPSEIAHVYAWIGDADSAFEWLDRAVSKEDLGDQYLLPFYRTLHEDPRWRQFLEKTGQTPERLAAIEFKVTLPG